MSEPSIPSNEVKKAVFRPSSSSGILLLRSLGSNASSPMVMPMKVPNTPKVDTKEGSCSTHFFREGRLSWSVVEIYFHARKNATAIIRHAIMVMMFKESMFFVYRDDDGCSWLAFMSISWPVHCLPASHFDDRNVRPFTGRCLANGRGGYCLVS